MNAPDRSQMPTLQEVPWMYFPGIESAQLSNGIPVYMIPFGQQEIAEVRLVFHSRGFHLTHPGQASFAASMLTEGTRNLSAKEFAEAADFYGANIQADSGLDGTSVSLSSLSRHLGATLELLREATFFPRMAEADFAQMKIRRLQSLEVDEKQTSYVARRNFNRLLFGEAHPYGMSAGIPEVQALDLDAVKKYHSDEYDPAACSIVVSGAVKPAEMMQLLETALGSGLPARQSPSAFNTAATAAPASGLHFFAMKDAQQATLRMGHLAFRRDHPDYHAMQFVNTLFGGYFGSRLMKNIREEKGFTYGIGSGWVSLRDSGLFIIQTDCANAYVEQVRAEVKKELHSLMNEGCSETELNIVKNYMLGASLGSRETPSRLAETLVSYLTLGIPFERLDEKYEVVRSMTPQKVKELANKWFRPEEFLEVVCGME